MLRRFLGYLSQEVRGLHAAAYVLAGASLLSSLLALARDRLLAHLFGAGTTLDIYNAAFRIPDLIFVGTTALVSVYIIIPELRRRAENEQHEYIDTLVAGLALFAIVVSGIAFIFAPALDALFFPDLASQHAHELVLLTRIMLLQPILLGFSNILAGITQTRNRYALYALTGLLYNIGIIFGIGVLYPLIGIAGLGWGIVLGALLHLGIQVPSVVRDGFLRRVPRIWSMRALRDTVAISLPRSLALSMSELAELALIAIAGVLAPGSIAVFVFAYNLQAVPLGIIGASYSVAAFPTLAAALSRGEREGFLDHVALAARYVLFWSLPATALIVVLRAYLVRVILGTGAFSWTDTRLTAAVFALLALSLAAQGLTMLLIRAYYAAGRTFVPFLISAATAAATLLIAALALALLQHDWIVSWLRVILRLDGIAHIEVLALGVAYAFAAIAGLIGMGWHFERRFPGFFRRINRTLRQGVLAAFAAGIACYLALVFAGPIDVGSTTASVFLRGFAGGAAGLVSALACYAVLGSIELRELITALALRIRRIPILARVTLTASPEDQPGQM